ncbi:MAG: P22 coat protein - protein 5 domain protein [Acidobacteria bacterium]|nr:P22 coat protein - protein 5 domain protein [Acidobacteriota bacterium]MCA1620701.1 P22 coat protein - protein 5 domain protein [Acidobacteriota bacterium]
MSVATFIASVWAAALLAGLKKALVLAQPGVVNTQYEGVIANQGDTVKINFIGNISVFDVARNEDIPDPEQLSTALTNLVIDKAEGFNFQVDDVDKVQANGDLIQTAMGEAAYALRDKADQSVAVLHAEAHADNLIGSDAAPVSPTADTAYEYLVDAGTKLDEKNVPTEGRWAAVPPWFYGLLLKDKRFVAAGTSRTDEVLRNGEVGEAAGFRILRSNNVIHTAGTKYKLLAGHPQAITYADQIVSVESYRMEKRYADAVKGLHVYGRKVIRPQALVTVTANRA